MHKSQLMWDLVNRFGMNKKDAKVCVDTVFSSMADALEEQGRIEIRGFAMFKVKGYRPYRGRNPRPASASTWRRKSSRSSRWVGS